MHTPSSYAIDMVGKESADEMSRFISFSFCTFHVNISELELGLGVTTGKLISSDGNLSVVPVPARASCMICRLSPLISPYLRSRRQACSSTLLLSAMHGRCWDARASHFTRLDVLEAGPKSQIATSMSA